MGEATTSAVVTAITTVIVLDSAFAAIFTLMDTDAVLVDGKVKKAGLNWTKFWREVEVFPLIRLKSYTLAQLFYAAFHPVKAYREFRAWKRNKDRE